MGSKTDYQVDCIKYAADDKAHARVFHSTLYCEQFKTMQISTRLVYIYLVDKCGIQDYHRRKCTFQKEEVKKIGIKSYNTFKKAITELKQKGFIREKQREGMSETRHFELINKWKTLKGLVPEEEQYF